MRKLLLVGWLLAIVVVCANAQPAEWTIWDLGSEQSFPGDLVWMIDNSMFVSLYDPMTIARFEPDNNRLLSWPMAVEPGEFVLTNSGLLFMMSRDAGIGWLQPDANYLEYFSTPTAPASEPMFAMESRFGNGVENIWYMDWATGRLGLFEPTVLQLPSEAGPEPQVIPLASTSSTVLPTSEVVAVEILPGPGDLVPAIYILEPQVTPSFREWGLVTMDPPAYTFLEDNAGNVWVPDVVGQSILSLDPETNTVSVYDLPTSLFITSLASIPDGNDIYFTAVEDDVRVVLGILQPDTGDVALWEIPGGREVDAVRLQIVDDAIWFCDRGASAIYRFVPMYGEFTWWATGDIDDSPLYLVPGFPEEFWVSFEGTGKLARLRIQNE